MYSNSNKLKNQMCVMLSRTQPYSLTDKCSHQNLSQNVFVKGLSYIQVSHMEQCKVFRDLIEWKKHLKVHLTFPIHSELS